MDRQMIATELLAVAKGLTAAQVLTPRNVQENMIIRNKRNRNWGTWRVLRKYHPGIWEIRGDSGDRVLNEDEFHFWEIVKTAAGIDGVQEADLNTPEFRSWLRKCQDLVSKEEKRQFPNLPYETILSAKAGRRYIRVSAKSGASNSAWAFVDKQTGDILKPASWSKPAKHARGNIFDSSKGMKYISQYGPAYLR